MFLNSKTLPYSYFTSNMKKNNNTIISLRINMNMISTQMKTSIDLFTQHEHFLNIMNRLKGNIKTQILFTKTAT